MAKESTIKVVVVETGNPTPYVKEIPNTLEAMQEIVGGYIECIHYEGFDLFCNEEGKLQGLPLTFPLYYEGELYDAIAGNFFLSRADEDGEQVSLTDEECQRAIEIFTMTPEKLAKFTNDLRKMMST